VAAGKTMESLMSVVFDYNKLDDHDAAVRLRLNSTVVNVKEGTVPGAPEIITLSYVRQGTSFRVRTKTAVLACNNGIIPYICPQLPEAQKKALAFQVKSPILYTNVALTNWRAWKNLGLGAVVCPTGYHVNAMIDFPVSYGDYKFSSDPDQPVVIHMERFPHLSNAGLTAQEQYREGRRELIGTSFEAIERNVRMQLQDILGQGGFNAAEDIAGITVNRWAHGYAYYYNSLYDDTYEDDNDPRYPHVMARKPLGSIVIANSDAGASAMMESAIEQAHRAVGELK
jgi:spermidine dehydrogenase